LSAEPIPLDARWLAAHPLPVHGDGTDKNSRGRVVAVGGSVTVPGGLLLTGEAALRVGAGKLRMATVAEAALALGVAIPEAAVLALPSRDDEIAPEAADALGKSLERCDALVVGPAMSGSEAAAAFAVRLIAQEGDFACVLDAAAVAGCHAHVDTLNRCGRPLVLTPHYGEMARLLQLTEEEIGEHPEKHARCAAERFRATVVLKSTQTLIAAPDGTMLRYSGGGVGLATGGSGDVLAGAIAGLLSRGADPLIASAWGVWLHGAAGRRLAERIGPIGFLARELLLELPGLMASVR
jgi:ADP-dependent NAD(P)H-hydrate dehydratase